jgi:hypothetical protein
VLYGAGSLTNFSELRKGEVRRIHIPRARVNKGINRPEPTRTPAPSTTCHHIPLFYKQRVASILPPTLLGRTQLPDSSGAGNL